MGVSIREPRPIPKLRVALYIRHVCPAMMSTLDDARVAQRSNMALYQGLEVVLHSFAICL